MTKEELLEILRKEAADGGGEQGHMTADDALLDFINDPEITDAYNAIPGKWYS